MIPPKGWAEVISMYGDNKTVEQAHGTCLGDASWEHDNLIVLRNVQRTGLSIQLHRKVAENFERCLAKAMEACPRYPVRMLGGYCARHQRNDPALPLSIHSYGAAFDVNWDKNPMGSKLITDLPEPFVRAFTDAGWVWGGNWKSVKDAMHFQWAVGV